MGLDFQLQGKHVAPSFSYGGYNMFRQSLAKLIGMDLDSMDGFSDSAHPTPWPGTDDIERLLNFSDCEGEFTPEECAKIAPRLRDLAPKLPVPSWMGTHAISLAESMELAAKKKANLVLC